MKNEKNFEPEKQEFKFDRRMYGVLLRHMRTEAGYRKGEDFIADLSVIGLEIPLATLYRFERGDQEPTFEFIAAVNLLLFGDIHSGKISDSCLPEEWSTPSASDSIMRALKRNGTLSRIQPNYQMSDAAKASYYESLMASINSYDFEIFPNDSSTDEDLYMSIQYGTLDEIFDDENLGSYHIEYSDDVERSIIHFLKSHNFEISGEEINKLIQYGNKKMQSSLESYEII